METKKIGLLRELLSHPGETLKEVLESNNMTQKELAARLGLTEKHITGIINGKNSISKEVATDLAKIFPLTANFWVNLQANYDAELQKIEEFSKITEIEKEIVSMIDYSFLAKHNYIEPTRILEDKVMNLRYFWGVSNLYNVNTIYSSIDSPIAAFRKSECIESNPYAMATWIKICEIQTDNIEVSTYDIEKLKTEIPKIKNLMFLENPNEMVKKLRNIFADCGIAFAVVRNIKGAPVQGFIRKINNKMRMCITLRGANADRFWFTLFHEVGHLFSFSENLNIDYEKGSKCNEAESKSEREADKIADDILISDFEYREFVRKKNFSESSIINFSEKQQVLPCITIGRLQHDRHIPYYYFKKYMTKYQWVD